MTRDFFSSVYVTSEFIIFQDFTYIQDSRTMKVLYKLHWQHTLVATLHFGNVTGKDTESFKNVTG